MFLFFVSSCVMMPKNIILKLPNSEHFINEREREREREKEKEKEKENEFEHQTIEERWDRRWKDLYTIKPNLCKKFFDPVQINNWENNKFQPGIIFISIASYRDNQCISTLQNIAENADNPENLHFVICQQNSPLEKDCIKWCKKNPKHKACNISISHIERLSYTEARGPTWARWRIQQQWSGEEYFLQIDAHTRMEKHWDTILKNQLELCPSDKPILTQYPTEFQNVDEKDRKDPLKEKWMSGRNKKGTYVDYIDAGDGLTRVQADFTDDIVRIPYRSICWAAGFSFSKGEFIKEVGYDPYTPFLFFGEQMDIAIRAFTHGWDMFSPTINVIHHDYKRDHRKTFWENINQHDCEVLSRFRIYERLGMIDAEEIPEKYKFILIQTKNYPLGEQRTVEEYEKIAKIDIKNEKLLSRGY